MFVLMHRILFENVNELRHFQCSSIVVGGQPFVIAGGTQKLYKVACIHVLYIEYVSDYTVSRILLISYYFFAEILVRSPRK